jgi:ribosome biogenesis GTPase
MQTPERFEADVISAYGRHLLARDAAGRLLRTRPFGRSLEIVCGDRVCCERDSRGEVLVVEVLPRRTVLLRSNARGQTEAIVANLSLAAVVIAAVPRPDLFMVDRYLSAAASADLTALVIVNKADLALRAEEEAGLQEFVALGYGVHRVGARDGTGLAELAAALAGHTSVLLGQSGVGKSSLIRKLAADGAEAAIGELMRESEGRHTTTASRLYDCLGGPDHRLPGRARLRAVGGPAGGREPRVLRSAEARGQLPLHGLPSPERTAVRGAHGSGDGADQCAALRELPPAAAPVRATAG